MAKVLIDVKHRIGRIRRDIYGQYLEHLGIYDGLWAEMLKSPRFAEHDWENNEKYGVVKPWFAINRTVGMHYVHDNSEFYTGRQSQKIVLKKSYSQLMQSARAVCGLWPTESTK